MPFHSLDVFRFVSQRPVQRATSEELSKRVIPYDLTGSDEYALAPSKTKRMTYEEAFKWAKDCNESPEFVSDLKELTTPIATLDEWLLTQSNRIKPDTLTKQIKDVTRQKPEDLIQGEVYRADRRRVAVSLKALTLAPENRERLRDQLLRGMHIFGLIERLALQPGTIQTEQDVYDLLVNGVFLLSPDFPTPSDALARPPAITDLKVVRQQLLRYEMGEIAHIENVLKGESKEREHKRTNIREETTVIESEHEELLEKDLQSTQRYEMQQEASLVTNEDTHFEAGVTVSASYGPTVSVTANAGYETNYAQEESNRLASKYARDITERTASRIRDKIRQQRTIRTVTQTEETNKHSVNNEKGDRHVVGIYRWVDKVYKTQVYNYGKRLLLEFIVPEPAAFYKHLISQQSAKGVTLQEPAPPTVTEGSATRPLRPDDITPDNYLNWVATYHVSDVATPPPSSRWLSLAWDEPAKPETGLNPSVPGRKLYKSNRDIEIPEGYYAAKITGAIHASDWLHNIFITAGNMFVPLTEERRGGEEQAMSGYYAFNKDFANQETGKLPIILTLEHTWGYTISIMIKCDLLPEGFRKWQLATYEKITSAYNQLKSEYDEQVAMAATRQGISIQGNNPLENRSLERNELKKNLIAMLEQKHFNQPPIEQDAIQINPPEMYPEVNFNVASRERNYIQWFEQAFEWQQMTYVFYPYYWNKKQNWMKELPISDTDPIFAAFLKAGAARVAVPVRPGFEKAMSLYLATGIIWNGSQVPQVEDPLYVSIIQEIQEQQEAPSGGVAEGEPWEVRIPTTLTILQDTGTLPT